jgi:uncharacterized membrane protein
MSHPEKENVMLPDPLHPAVVHLPIALAVIVPLAAVATSVAVARRWIAPRAWAGVVLLQALLVGSTWLALETGEHEEERVERVVTEAPIEQHEEAAQRFLAVAVVGLVALGAGLLPRGGGAMGRVAGTVATVGVLAAGVAVGHSGGQLVYRHGAAMAYAPAAGADGALPPTASQRAMRDDD